MKIAEVDSILIADSHYVRITAENGTTGLGKSGAWSYTAAAVHALVEQFKTYLVGEDPLRIKHHWQYLYRMGPLRGSVLVGAISAVDIALGISEGSATKRRSGSS